VSQYPSQVHLQVNFSTTSASYKVAVQVFRVSLLYALNLILYIKDGSYKEDKVRLQLYCDSNLLTDECNINFMVS